jgi:hypothetical protein
VAGDGLVTTCYYVVCIKVCVLVHVGGLVGFDWMGLAGVRGVWGAADG